MPLGAGQAQCATPCDVRDQPRQAMEPAAKCLLEKAQRSQCMTASSSRATGTPVEDAVLVPHFGAPRTRESTGSEPPSLYVPGTSSCSRAISLGLEGSNRLLPGA